MTMQSVFESGSMTTILSWMMAWPALKSSLWKSPMRSLMAAARIISTLGRPVRREDGGRRNLGLRLVLLLAGRRRHEAGHRGRVADGPHHHELRVEAAELDPRGDHGVDVLARGIAPSRIEDEAEDRVLGLFHQLEHHREIGGHRACLRRSHLGRVRGIP